MRTILLITMILIAIPLQASLQNQEATDQYSKDHESVKKSGQVWIVLIGEDWWPACFQLHGRVKSLKDIKVTKLKLTHPVIPKFKELYTKKNWKNGFKTIPEWMIIRYEDGKLVYISRYNDSPNINEIIRRVNMSKGKILRANRFYRYSY